MSNNVLVYHDSDCHDSAILIVFSTIDIYHLYSLQLSTDLILFRPVDCLFLQYHSEAFFF